ncbi:polysaccharide biosynthesis C-terminal domain-containing protein [Lactiplantibacillus pingfangensis]|uniref:oligosaccharide flippase family protein n=1 Tax=Lactiplantibacillus pingfangensis TaxID=2559915 RepID=UPI0010F691DA|nr:polysaccharide biosynthesis C-terminal domain-containing protein [Lactiplantibacillus pingfangensis]
MKLVKNYLYNASYNLLILLTPLLTVPYISRVLGPTGVGINATTNSVITYFLLAGTVGITIYGNREIAFIRDDEQKRSQVFWEIELLQILTIALAYIAFLIFLLFETQFKMAFFYQSFYIIAGAFDISWYFMGLEDFKKTVVRNTFVKLASLVAIFTLVKSSHDVGTYILILSLSQLLGNVSLWPYLIKSISKPVWPKINLFRHLLPSLSLFVPQVATTIYLAVNKTMLWKLDSVVASGYYDYSDKLIKIVLAVVTATGTVMLPHIANLYANHKMAQVKKYLYLSFDFVLAISMPMAFGIAGVATTFAPWFFGAKFSSVNTLLIIEAPIIIFIGLSNVLGQQYLLPTKRTKEFTKSVVLGALVNIIINVPLILFLGVRGAMYATVFSELAVTAYQLFCVRKDLSIPKLFINFGKYALSAVIMFITVYELNVMMPISTVNLIIQILIGLLIYVGLLLILKPTILKQLKLFRKE